MTLVATTKTFNLAGAMIGSIVTADDYLRKKFCVLLRPMVPHLTVLA